MRKATSIFRSSRRPMRAQAAVPRVPRGSSRPLIPRGRTPLIQSLAITSRSFSSFTNAPAPIEDPEEEEQTWVQVLDKESGEYYWWCELTDETTCLGADKPKVWTEVLDQATGLTYWWCKETDETTEVGVRRPTWAGENSGVVPVARSANPFLQQPLQASQQQQHAPQQQEQGGGLGSMFIWGAGMTVGVAMIGALFR